MLFYNKINYNIESADILALGLLFISALIKATVIFAANVLEANYPESFCVGFLSLVGFSFVIGWCKLMVYGIVQNLRRMSRQIFIFECTIVIRHTKHVIIETYLLMNTYILIDTYFHLVFQWLRFRILA